MLSVISKIWVHSYNVSVPPRLLPVFNLWTDQINEWIVILTTVLAVYCELRILELHNHFFQWFFPIWQQIQFAAFFKNLRKHWHTQNTETDSYACSYHSYQMPFIPFLLGSSMWQCSMTVALMQFRGRNRNSSAD